MYYDYSRIRTRTGVAKLYFYYSYLATRRVAAYFLSRRPDPPFRGRLSQVKPLRTIASEVWKSWRKWNEFPFSYFIEYLWVEYDEEFSDLEDFAPLIRYEIHRDRRLTLQTKLVLDSKVFMSKLLRANGVPHPVPVVYAESGHLFCSENRLIEGPTDLSRIMASVGTSRMFVKDDVSYGGRTVRVFSATEDGYKSSDGQVIDFEFLERLASTTNFICQEELQQIDALSALNPTSINTVRVMTKFRTTGVDVLAAILRVGRAGSCVDNAGRGSLCCEVNLRTWSTTGTAVLWNSVPFEFCMYHPDSGEAFHGIKLPFRQETFSLLKGIAILFPGCEIIGWDIALTPDGPVIVEGNWNAGLRFPQMSMKKGLATALFD
jgi:hypothetical protein